MKSRSELFSPFLYRIMLFHYFFPHHRRRPHRLSALIQIYGEENDKKKRRTPGRLKAGKAFITPLPIRSEMPSASPFIRRLMVPNLAPFAGVAVVVVVLRVTIYCNSLRGSWNEFS